MVVGYNKFMKGLKKILLLDLPPALSDALGEHLGDFSLTVASTARAEPFDLVVKTKGARADIAACPVLDIPPGPQRLGSLLRSIGRRLAEPALYLGDIALGGWTLRPQEGRLGNAAGQFIDLTDRETDMLAYLARQGGGPVRREDLLRQVWGYQDGVDTHTLETHIHRLRRKIGAEGIVTDAGGYSLGIIAPDAVE